ncbi:MAG: Methyltransferase type 12 [Chitinophagaceae bacterium]|nr:Methyltransferase type 12 [Chitinophagaceae bacterium]
MFNNYDKIASYYDRLSGFVFGHSLIDAQSCLLKYIQPGNNILIAGGGTGIILAELAKRHARGLTITYVEISGKMIVIAKKRNCRQNLVSFIHQPVENFISEQQYDIIVTPFLFDNFTENKIEKTFTSLNALLKPGGKWLFADFFYDNRQGKLWQKLLLRIMYRFFRLTCNIEASVLINMESIFERSGYEKIYETTHYAGFIKSIVYTK